MTKIKNYFDGNKIDLNKEKITSYVCGPTVYSDVHVGNVRSILIMDIFAKALRYKGKELDLVHNITDIDDKIIAKANELNKTEKEISEKYTKEYLKILELLNIDSIKYSPKVTENVESMIKVISLMIEKGYAYEVNGSVYFRVNKIDDYGKIHKVSQDELKAEQESNSDKESNQDFAL
jgi:cysteinyl-tRNA synthetase